MGGALFLLLRGVLVVLTLLIVGRALSSWVDPRGETPIGRFLVVTTEPILAPVRQVLPRTGAVDLSPLVVRLVLAALLRVVL
jgi:YggT family protein